MQPYSPRMRKMQGSGRCTDRFIPLSIILERLQRVEESLTNNRSNADSSSTGPDTDPSSGTSSRAPEPFATPSRATSTDLDSPTSRTHPPLPVPPPRAAKMGSSSISFSGPCSIWTGTRSPDFLREASDGLPLDAAAVLTNALIQVERIRVKGLATATVTEQISIPSDLAKIWIKNYFTRMPEDAFTNLFPGN
ncbi:unnamed protein product [Parascedosporium putredinis]|uniref:Uncharacterized protein n=1 Tax=Parascedosporium putredinis TaxID=1442378 RepID=A0A9P1MAG7_9PEZI|nr:unnamed protein product [Parascedosporium putredinis]CAI7994104.1 unnamed protein product [Parascedosporium putredinis]